MTEGNDQTEQTAVPETERTVTISGKPILIAGALASVSLRWIRRRKRQRRTLDTERNWRTGDRGGAVVG